MDQNPHTLVNIKIIKKEAVLLFDLQCQACGNDGSRRNVHLLSATTQIIWGAVHIAHLTKKRHFLEGKQRELFQLSTCVRPSIFFLMGDVP